MRLPRILLSALLPIIAATSCFGQRTPIVFLQIADPQMGMFSNNHGSQQEILNLSAVVKEANRLQPAFLVICGDLVNDGRDSNELQAFKKTIGGLNGVPLHLVPGNHDVGNHPTASQLALYRQRYGPDYYEFSSGPMIGIVLDSMLMADNAPRDEASRQYQWLKKMLRKASAEKTKQVAIFQHIPFFVHTADEPDSYWNIPLAQRSLYLALLHSYEVKYVFAGHLHHPALGRDGNLQIITVGATGKPLDNSFSGFNLVQVVPDGQWQHKYFPLTAMPSHLQPPW